MYYFRYAKRHVMFEFLVGMILGVWAGQALPLPSVGNYVRSYWVLPAETQAPVEEAQKEEEQPFFTGDMPVSVPPPAV